MNNVYMIFNELYRSTGYFAFVCSLRLNLRPRHSFEDMTHLKIWIGNQSVTCSFDAIKSVLKK